MENKETIVCWLYNDKSSFDVEIDPVQSISQLKKRIVAENPERLGKIDPVLLELYRDGGFQFCRAQFAPGIRPNQTTFSCAFAGKCHPPRHQATW
jgi:hypothetical protein